MRSWRTTVLGVATIVAAVAGAAQAMLDGNPATSFDPMATATAITAGIGLLLAKDARVGGQGGPVPP